MAPGPLSQGGWFPLPGIFESGQAPGAEGRPFNSGAGNKVSEWAEMLIVEGAQPLAYYDHPFFGKYPAITQNHFGDGTLTYEGTRTF